MLQFLLEFQNTDRRQLGWYGVGIKSRTCTGLRCKNLLLPGCPGSPCRTNFPVDCVEKEKQGKIPICVAWVGISPNQD